MCLFYYMFIHCLIYMVILCVEPIFCRLPDRFACIRWGHTIRNCIFRSESLDISYFWIKIKDSRHFQLAIYTVFHEESESEVKKCKKLQPGGKNQEKRSRESRFLIVGFLIVCLHRSVFKAESTLFSRCSCDYVGA